MENTDPLHKTIEPEASANLLPLTLEDIYKEKIFETTRLREPHWMQDGQRFSYLATAPDSEVTTLWMYDLKTDARKMLIEVEKFKLPKSDLPGTPPKPNVEEGGDDEDGKGKEGYFNIHGYQWSPDESRVLFARLPQRRSTEHDTALYLYTLADRSFKRITQGEHSYRNAKWSPDGKTIGYVREDDLYLLDPATGHETRLTNTAAPTIYNGRFGWVYEEELNLIDGWAFSPDGKRFAYFQVDETQVPQVELPNYEDLHQKPVVTRYPKAGDPNPIIKIGVLTLETIENRKSKIENPATHWIDLGPDTDIYISRMQWTPGGELLLHRMPRLQNRIELLKADLATGKTTVILTEEDKAWTEARGDLTFVKGSDQFLWLSDRSGFNHLYLYDLSGKLIRPLTSGSWDVDSLSGVDSTHRIAYFTAARPTPMQRQIFSVLLDGGGEIMPISEAPGSHQALFAPDGQHFLGTHSSRTVPLHTKLYRAGGRKVADIHDNPMPKLQGRTLGEWEFMSFKTSDNVTLNAAMLRPADFDPKRKYPVLMYTYGGPGSQVVMDSYGNGGGLEQMLAQKGYLFVMVDGRGSGMRGRDFEKVTYQNLGHWEVHDQIEGAKWLKSLPYVDPKRIGIWGWSYGGYMASLCILRGAEVFKAAMAVAPVTHWSLYDSIYTERYMRRPADNPKGYAESSPLTHADKLQGKFLLAHGMADDNVHFQNTARLAALFQKQNKTFRAMFYPGKHHGIEGVSEHLFAMLTDFILENL